MPMKPRRTSYVDPATVTALSIRAGTMDALQRSKSSPEDWANAKPSIEQAAE